MTNIMSNLGSNVATSAISAASSSVTAPASMSITSCIAEMPIRSKLLAGGFALCAIGSVIATVALIRHFNKKADAYIDAMKAKTAEIEKQTENLKTTFGSVSEEADKAAEEIVKTAEEVSKIAQEIQVGDDLTDEQKAASAAAAQKLNEVLRAAASAIPDDTRIDQAIEDLDKMAQELGCDPASEEPSTAQSEAEHVAELDKQFREQSSKLALMKRSLSMMVENIIETATRYSTDDSLTLDEQHNMEKLCAEFLYSQTVYNALMGETNIVGKELQQIDPESVTILHTALEITPEQNVTVRNIVLDITKQIIALNEQMDKLKVEQKDIDSTSDPVAYGDACAKIGTIEEKRSVYFSVRNSICKVFSTVPEHSGSTDI